MPHLSRRVWRAIVVLIVSSALGIGSSLPAYADIYWSSWGAQEIQHAPLNGSGAAVLVPSAGANLNQVSVGSNGYVYWADYDANAIGRSKLDGTEAEPLWFTGADQPTGVAVTATHIYWSEDGNGRVSRATIDGTNAEPNFVPDLLSPHGLGVDNQNLYIADTSNNRILRASLNGGPATQVVAVTGPQMVAVNSTHIYWTDMSGGHVGRAKLDGSQANNALISTPANNWVYGVGLDSDYVYWTNYTGSSSVGRAKLDGSDQQQDFIPNLYYPAGLYVVGAPTITSVSPSDGSVAGGTRITVNGSSFFQGAEVTVGSKPCAAPTWVAWGKIQCTTPAGVAGKASITVTNPDGSSVTSANRFTYTSAQVKHAQTPLGKCAQPPRRVKKKGRTVILKAHCMTNADRKVRVKVAGMKRSRGEVINYRVIRRANGRTILRTYGVPLRIKITWSAPATKTYKAYRNVHWYRT